QPAESLFLLHRSLRQRGTHDGAVALLRRAQEAFPGDFWINLDLGMALQDCQPPQYDEALRFLTAAAALRPGRAGVQSDLWGRLWRKGRLKEAVAACQKATAHNPDYTVAHHNIALVLSSMGQHDGAITACRKVIGLQPDHASAYLTLGSALSQKAEYQEA